VADGVVLEQTILGHALNDSSCFQLFISEVEWQSFLAPNHKVIAFCLKRMAANGIRFPDEDSFQLVVSQYPSEDKDYGGAEYIRSLQTAFIDPTENYQSFIQHFKLHSAKAKIGGDRLQNLLQVCNSPQTSADDVKKVVASIQEDIEGASTSGFNFKDAIELGDEYLASLEDRKDQPFHTTGLGDLDTHLAQGFAPKLVSILAGFTGMAKSTVAIHMAHRIAVQGIGVAMFSMESTSVSLMDKMVSTLTQIPLGRLKKESADLTEEERNSISVAVDDIGGLPILINDQASVSMDGMLYQIQCAQRRGHNPKVVIIDLFGKLEDVDTGDNLAARIQREMKRVRVLAKSLDIHFVCVVQIGRQGFGRGRQGSIKRPTLIDIKNANAYAEEADLVLLLHRNKYYLPDLEDDILEVDIAKQRDGEANIKVYFEMFADRSTIMGTDKMPHDRGGEVD
jgi:replicative DNA helicase